MPQVKYAPETHEDFERFKRFLLEVAPEKISEAIDVIFSSLEILEHTPLAGESYPLESVPEMRKLVISYGQSGYIALYTFDQINDTVIIHAIRHQKELNFISLLRQF